jgi:hypothetical protein
MRVPNDPEFVLQFLFLSLSAKGSVVYWLAIPTAIILLVIAKRLFARDL